jgi:hypothetical protein
LRALAHGLSAAHAPSAEERLRARELGGSDAGWLFSRHDERTPLPEGAAEVLRPDNPRLRELRERFATAQVPAARSLCPAAPDGGEITALRFFRGEPAWRWRRRELPGVTRLKMFVYLSQVRERDRYGLLERLGEDGLFGCWTYEYEGHPAVSRELLDCIGLLLFLDRELGVLRRSGLRVLDIAPGYGALAHRTVSAAAEIGEYCCVGKGPEGTFLCEYYLGFRGCSPPARVLAPPELDALAPGSFDLALASCGVAGLGGEELRSWLARLRQWRVPALALAGGDAPEVPDWRALEPILAGAGYRLLAAEPAIADPAARQLTRLTRSFAVFAPDAQANDEPA